MINRKIFTSVMFLALVLAAFWPATGSAAQKIRINGDPCTVPLAQKLGEAFSRKSGVEIVYTTGGCRSGVASVIDGAADIGVSTYNFDEGKLHGSLHKVVIGKAPIIMIVNRKNPVENITTAQLQGILRGEIRNWKEVGGPDMQIKNVMLAPCVVETMTHQVDAYSHNLKKLAPRKKGNPVKGTNVMVEGDEAAIGMQLYGYESDNVKALKIDGVLPTEETMGTKYNYYEEYNIVTSGKPEGAVKDYIDFALSYEGRRILLSMKHVPKSN